jgi:hypothetical protein
MPVIPIMIVASAAIQGYGMYEQNKAAKSSAGLATATSGYNARVDMAEAKQIELDSTQNTRNSRKEADIYLSRQKASYAASGVLASGSPLAAMASTAGALEQRTLQDRSDAMREASKRESAARIGVAYGDATAAGIRAQNRVDMFRGGAQILSTVASGYRSGAFSSAGSNAPSGLLASGAPSSSGMSLGRKGP